jgi:serine/threonine-protein kinase
MELELEPELITPSQVVTPSQVFSPSQVVTPSRPVAVGLGSGITPTLPEAARAHTVRLAAIVVAVAVVVVAAFLLLRSRPAPQPPAPVAQPAPPLAAPEPPAPVEVAAVAPAAAPLAQEGTVRVQTDGPASFTVDGKSAHLAADGMLHLPPGRHKVSLQSPLLAGARGFEVEVKNGETVTRAVHSGRGRLRIAVTPWAEVQLDGKSVGTTPIAPLELREGTHTLLLKNGDLQANVSRRVVVVPDKETVLRVDLFGR